MGNHVWDQRELIGHIDREPRIVRPLNLAPGTPGPRRRRDPHRARPARRGPAGARPAVHGAGRRPVPRARRRARAATRWAAPSQAIVVDVHAEATSEKLALAHHLRRAGVRWSSAPTPMCRPPTAQILAGGTGYITDLGMTGDYDSVIGMDKAGSLQKWRTDLPVPAARAGDGRGHAVRRLRRDRRPHRPRAPDRAGPRRPRPRRLGCPPGSADAAPERVQVEHTAGQQRRRPRVAQCRKQVAQRHFTACQ